MTRPLALLAALTGSTQFTSTDSDLVVGPRAQAHGTAQPAASFTSDESDF